MSSPKIHTPVYSLLFLMPNSIYIRVSFFLLVAIISCLLLLYNQTLIATRSHFCLMESVELKVEMAGLHEKRVRKCLAKLKGIVKVEVEASKQKVVVTGCAHRNKVLKALRRAGIKADFWSVQNELLHAYSAVAFPTFKTRFRFSFF